MSTKSTIVYGPTFHLYYELVDEDAVYLELEGVRFEASYNHVVVPIPVHIWEVIRTYAGVDLSWASWSDEELRAYVERRVDERLARVAEVGPDSIAGLMGAVAYGDVRAPRDEQIAQGVRHVERERDHQRQIVTAIEELRELIRSRHAQAPSASIPDAGTQPSVQADDSDDTDDADEYSSAPQS